MRIKVAARAVRCFLQPLTARPRRERSLRPNASTKKKPAKRKVVTPQGSRYTECAACEEHFITLLHASCPSCSPDTRAPAPTPALSSPDSVAFLVNPGKYFSSGVWIEPHLTIVFPPLHGSWAWCPKGLGVINLTLPMSAGPVLASGGFARPTPVEFFHVSQHTARSSRCSLARGVYKELVARYAAVVVVEEAQPLYAPEHKVALRVHVQPDCSPPFEIELFFAGQGSRDLELHPSRTEPWRNTGHVLSSRAALWRVRFRRQLPPATLPCDTPQSLL